MRSNFYWISLEGRRDPGLQVQVFSDVVDKDGNILEDQKKNIKTYYTVQKLKEIQEGIKKTTSFVVMAVTDPTDYDKRDPKANPGLNFRRYDQGNIVFRLIDSVDNCTQKLLQN